MAEYLTGRQAVSRTAHHPEQSPALMRELVTHLRHNRTQHRAEWARRIADAQLLTAMSPEEIFSEATSVYDNYVHVLETGSVEALQDYAGRLSEKIIARGVETHEVLGIVLLLRDVLARSLFQKYQDDYTLLTKVLDVYEPAANRIANTVGVSFVQERERVIRQQQQQLKEQETRLRQLVQSLDAIVWEADANTFEFTFMSQPAEDILGHPVSRLLEPGFSVGLIHPDDRDRAIETRRAAAAEGKDYVLEYRAITPDGRVVWLRDIVHVVQDESHARRWLRGVMVDITQMKEAQQVLEKSRQRFAYQARTLQQSLLPLKVPEIPNVEVAVRYQPAAAGHEVGGDFYDIFSTAHDEWAVVIGDVQGKGVRAAALTGLARYTIRTATMYERRPSAVLSVLNQTIMRQTADESSPQFCTVVFGRLQTNRGAARLTLANGGHEQPRVVRRNGVIEKVSNPGMLLGVFADADIFDHDVYLHPGDAVVLFTDGIVDARREKEEFGEARLENVLASCAGGNASVIADRIEHAAISFRHESSPDDMALLVLRVPPGGS
jgi:PAS domain S-box-containing protein